MKLLIAPVVVASCLTGSLFAQTLSNYQATVTGQGPTAYYKLDNSTLDSGVTAFGAGGFASDRYRNPSNSYFFVNTTDFLSIVPSPVNGGGTTNLTSTSAGSITFLFRTLDAATNTGQRFIFSGGNNATNGNALGLFQENTNSANGDTNSIKLRFGNNTTTVLQASNIVADTWYYFAVTYLESRSPNKAVWYIGQAGGTLMSGVTSNSPEAVAGEAATLYLGNKDTFDSAFRNPGNGRIDEFAVWNRELSATEISNQFSKLPQIPATNATYPQVIASQIPSYFFELNNSLTNSIGPTASLSTNGTEGYFTSDVVGNANGAFALSTSSNVLFITNDVINGGGPGANSAAAGTGSLSFLFRMLSDTNNAGQRYIFDQGAGTSGNLNQFAFFLENTNNANSPAGNANSLKLRIGNGPTTVALSNQFLIPNAWYYFALTWDESRNSAGGGEIRYYIGNAGGALNAGSIDIGNTAVVGDNGTFYLGNRETLAAGYASPGDGAFDALAFWNEELSATEIAAQFVAMTNSSAVAGPAPQLNILLSAPNVVLQWPASTDASYALESTSTLVSPSWSGAGAPAISGTNYVVTNSISGTRFYRLHKP